MSRCGGVTRPRERDGAKMQEIWRERKCRLVDVCAPKIFRGSSPDGDMYLPVAPVVYQVILEPGIGQFREFESQRVHTRINSWGLFLVHKLTCGKRESLSQQPSMKPDEQWNC